MAKRKGPDSFTDMEPESKRLKSATSISLDNGADEMKENLDFSPEQIVALAQAIFTAAARGEDMTISSVLSGLQDDVVKNVLQFCFCQPWSPLHVAVASGHMQVVEYFLNYISETLKYVCGERQKCSMSVLNIAAWMGHKEIVHLFLSTGAHVNQVDDRHRTALHEACRFGHVRIVEYLLGMGAHPDVVDVDNNTCLMDACRGGHDEAVRLLLEAGANPNQSGPDNVTALHVAAEWNAVGSTRLLLQHGASVSLDSSGQTPLAKAILMCSSGTVRVLIDSLQTSRWDRIKGLEYLGTVGISNYSTDEAFKLWCLAMEEKHEQPPDNLVCLSSRPTLLNVAQSQTMNELLSLQSNYVGQLIESVLILEKIAGQQCPLIHYFYTELCDALAENGRYSDVLSVFNRGMKMFSSVFKVDKFYDYMFSVLWDTAEQGKRIEFATIEESLLLVVQDIELDPTGKQKNHSEELVAFCCLLIPNALIAATNEENMESLKNLVIRLVKVFPSLDNCYSLLHHLTSHLVGFEGHLVKQHIPGIMDLVAECGADMNAVGQNGNTPLHDVALCSGYRNMEVTCIITENLLDNGAHIDTPNIHGQTALDVAKPAVKTVLCQRYPLSLQCLAASTVVSQKVPYLHWVPTAIQNYIKLHVPGQTG